MEAPAELISYREARGSGEPRRGLPRKKERVKTLSGRARDFQPALCMNSERDRERERKRERKRERERERKNEANERASERHSAAGARLNEIVPMETRNKRATKKIDTPESRPRRNFRRIF